VINLTLSFSLLFANYQSYYDPSFNWEQDSGTFYWIVRTMLLCVCALYLMYFGMISYMAIYSVRKMKKSYRIVFYSSIVVTFLATVTLGGHGLGGYGNRSVTYVFLFSIFNIYVMMISYMYSPTWEGFMKLQMDHAREQKDENNEILDSFYKETELGDVTKRELDDTDETLEEEIKG
jgi:hypothetical protein